MNKKVIKLTESDLHKIVKESVNMVLNESYEEEYYQMGYTQGIESTIEWLKTHINDYLVKGRDIDLMFDDLRNSV